MSFIAKFFIGLIAFIHLYIMWFEMFAWTSRGPEVFGSFPKEVFEMTGVMAANQGLYNGFLAAGLIWTFFIRDVLWSRRVAVFFLSCVAVAGLYAAVTIELKVLFVQTVPAVTTMVFLFCMKLSGDGVMIKENVT